MRNIPAGAKRTLQMPAFPTVTASVMAVLFEVDQFIVISSSYSSLFLAVPMLSCSVKYLGD